jgi:hypothetical protein
MYTVPTATLAMAACSSSCRRALLPVNFTCAMLGRMTGRNSRTRSGLDSAASAPVIFSW